MRWSHAVASAMVLIASGCAPNVLVTPLGGTFPPRRQVQELLVFSTQTPASSYQELAILTAYQGEVGKATEMENVLTTIKERAHSLGADAIVALRHVNEGGAVTRDGYSGTAVRFTDEACMR